jgi:hypothetical protein
MTDELKLQRINDILNNFIDYPDFYNTNDFVGIKDVIADVFYNNHKIIGKISKNKNRRNLLGSSKLLMIILKNLNNKNFQFLDGNAVNDFFFLIDMFLLYEESFFDKKILLESIDFLAYSIEIIDADIIKKGQSENKKKELDILLSFFKRIIKKIKLEQADHTKFKILYDRVKIAFQYSNYSHQETWFKFYVFYQSHHKEIPAIKTDVINVINAFIQNSPDPKKLIKTISQAMDMKDFLSIDSNHFSNKIFSICRNKIQFAKSFYSDFDNQKRQSLIEFYVPVNNNKPISNFKTFIEAISYDVPDKLSLANKILTSTRTLNNQVEVKQFFKILLNLELDESEISSTDFELQITKLILNTNIQLHQAGVELFDDSKRYLDIKKLKDKAIIFLISHITNLNSYHIHFSNILNLKIAITKIEFSKRIKGNQSNLNYIKGYLVTSGNVRLYNAIISKLTDELILEINNHIISSISYNEKYREIIMKIDRNRGLLSNGLYEKTSILISKIK